MVQQRNISQVQSHNGNVSGANPNAALSGLIRRGRLTPGLTPLGYASVALRAQLSCGFPCIAVVFSWQPLSCKDALLQIPHL
jgi:hypothetical protein